MKIGTLIRINDVNDSLNEFKKAASIGATCCQLVYKPVIYNTSDALLIKQAAIDSGIEITAQFCGYNDNDTVWDNYYGFLTSGLNVEAYRKSRLDYVRAAINFASNLDISDVVIHAGFVPNNPFDEKYHSLVTAIKLLAEHAKSLSMNILLETGGEAPIVLKRLIEDVGTGNLYINFDPANILMYGYGNPVDALKIFGLYVRNMHGKDGCLPSDTRNLGCETPVGEGMVDFNSIFNVFNEIGYDRYIIIEREISGEKQKQDIIKAMNYFEKFI